jgi:hypothetical protein
LGHTLPPAARRKQEAVVAALRHSWAGYAKFAWGFDELMPLTQVAPTLFS